MLLCYLHPFWVFLLWGGGAFGCSIKNLSFLANIQQIMSMMKHTYKLMGMDRKTKEPMNKWKPGI